MKRVLANHKAIKNLVINIKKLNKINLTLKKTAHTSVHYKSSNNQTKILRFVNKNIRFILIAKNILILKNTFETYVIHIYYRVNLTVFKLF